MNARQFRAPEHLRTFAQFRWLGWVMLMMFVLIQTATGTPTRSEGPGQQNSRLLEADADFNPQTHEVTVKAKAPESVWDATTDIGHRSFVVYEDGIRQTLEDVDVAHTPLSLGVLLENGGRYRTLNESLADNVSRATRDLLQAIGPDDKVTMWTYSDSVRSLDTPSTRVSALQPAYLNLPVPPPSESNFYDAVLATLPQVEQMPGRKALVIVSSGLDSFSKAGFPEVMQVARESGVPICVLDIGPLLRSNLLVDSPSAQSPYSRMKWQQASSQLSRLAKVSGCRATTPDSSLEFPAAYDALLANLRLQYVIRYRSTALDLPGTRHVEVAWLDHPGRQTRLTQSTRMTAGGGEFAHAQYKLDAPAEFATTLPTDWLLFGGTSWSAIRIPLKAPDETQPHNSNSAWESATTLNESATQGPWFMCARLSCLD
jgi:hypothetical protein